ncbi:MAG: hypothetical protein FJ405_10325 [Verrucomicrobia bacterium]|nr:hypothetical protein [Verrucomicrobiota bacterium]
MLIVLTGVFAAVALMGTPTVLYWAVVWAKYDGYRVATFQVQDTLLSNPQRGFKRFWILHGHIEGRSEKLSVPWKSSVNQSPLFIGDSVQVRYNSEAPTIGLAGRNVRTITLDEYSAAGRNLAVSAAGFFGPVVAVALLWFVRRLRRGSLNAANSLEKN